MDALNGAGYNRRFRKSRLCEVKTSNEPIDHGGRIPADCEARDWYTQRTPSTDADQRAG